MTRRPVTHGAHDGAGVAASSAPRDESVRRAGSLLHAAAWVSGTLAAGAAIMAVAHSGVRIPLISALGPGGSRAVIPAAIAFSVGACLHGAVAYGAWTARRWVTVVGVLVGAVTLLSAATPFRGVGSVAGITLAGAQIALLVLARVQGSEPAPRRTHPAG